jgi:hypothetical protein
MVTRNEALDVTWFATAGHFSNASTGDGVDTTLDLAKHPAQPGATVDVWAIAHDGRGGSDVAHRRLILR